MLGSIQGDLSHLLDNIVRRGGEGSMPRDVLQQQFGLGVLAKAPDRRQDEERLRSGGEDMVAIDAPFLQFQEFNEVVGRDLSP
jgi:hypothetical protein